MKKKLRYVVAAGGILGLLLVFPATAAVGEEAAGETVIVEETTENAVENTAGEQEPELPADSDTYLEAIMEELNLKEVDTFSEDNLPERISFSGMVAQMVENGVSGLDGETVCTWVFDLFFYELANAKPLFIQMLIFAVLFAVINRFFINCGTYVSEMSFLMVYGAMMILLMQSFLLVSEVVTEGVAKVSEFLAALVPAYATTLMLSGNAATAGAFYEMAFGIICVLEWAMKVLLVPGIHIFVLLMLLDHLFEEEKLTKFAELIESGIGIFLKITVSGVIGLGVVQSLLGPARDRISGSVVLKSMTAIPGVGNSIHFAEEILLGCGMLVKNSVGVAGLIVLVFLCATPVMKVFCFTFLYRLLVAVLQPVADKRVVECIQGVARGSALYLKIMVDTMLLFLITISMVTASTSFVY